ncbi:unnamed protein product [Caretta caretta]
MESLAHDSLWGKSSGWGRIFVLIFLVFIYFLFFFDMGLLGRRRYQYCCCYVGKASNELSLLPKSSVPHRGEIEAPQGKLTNLDGTDMDPLVKYVEDKFENQLCHKSEGCLYCGSRSQEATNKSQSFTQRELSRLVSAEQIHQKKEECEKLKKEKRLLEERLENILANAVRSHKFSENDPYQESAVLEMYDRPRTHE